jgi:pre-mRNA-splicing factor ATP-dependent RNA helicase DHX38/PRP16
VDFS